MKAGEGSRREQAGDCASTRPISANVGHPRAAPALADALGTAAAALAHCSDLVNLAGCRPASTYLDGAMGNLRNAMSHLAYVFPHLCGQPDFEGRRIGESEVIGRAGFADTVVNCKVAYGRDTVRALVPARTLGSAAWLRPIPDQPGIWMRGRVVESDDGPKFIDDPELELPLACGRGPDLARDLLAAGLCLTGRPVLAVALEVTLASGSWMHLPTGKRWYADRQTARAVVRLLGGCPAIDAAQSDRLGGCLDHGALAVIEPLGWRQWPTPGLP